MKRIFLVGMNMFRILFRKKSSFVLYLLLPVLIAGAAFFLTHFFSTTVTVGVVNEDDGSYGKAFVNLLGQVGNAKIVSDTPSQLRQALDTGTVDYGIAVGRDFSRQIQSGTVPQVTFYQYGSSASSGMEELVSATLKSEVGRAAGESGESVSVKTVSVPKTTSNGNKNISTMGLFIMFLLFSASFVSELIIEDKAGGAFYRVISTPVSEPEYVLGNILVNLVIVSAQILIALAAILFLFHIEVYVAFWKLFLTLLLFGCTATAFGILIASFCKEHEQANSLQTLIILPTSMISGCLMNISIMPDAVQNAARLTPQYWTLEAITSLQKGERFLNTLPDLLILAGFASLFFLVAIFVFKRNRDLNAP
ncbi:ABC transporter permease [Ethanoligenens harbinense]|uniref:ABC-2 type transporter n=1 Tax=Ethanoligenens harbinense (strain DSM 18485 / JCM 12961 / CGMCC 1.5033 / YUAN-3) TaxID=663278 RepID=E6U7C6_ETHHY|nr:ABC transporter permease [Ethanoligenens harbinense]ADU25861.1 ABC-2 type transporter [Ethanoligenens harbinense YUAN-3]AVQ95021.1 ABC transporter permease [Ethanoligenens harbinense YUAN-3]AYF37714.1 ABC transporter permease [Ethanoligenens harbinense]AYF40433.1 ABC transporter permease [Ethanoligenens harbinense]QCN91268.1 ABC transporter permease [Ethanoligenens harbinense]